MSRCLRRAGTAITTTLNGARHFDVRDEDCVGCNLCVCVCPIENCITLERLTGGVDPRTGVPIDDRFADWTTHPNNPAADAER